MAKHEPVTDYKSPMPKGYAFLKKGDVYKTGLCRRLSHEAGRTLYIVTAGRKPIGIRAPCSIIKQVFERDRNTKEDRRVAVTKRDDATQLEFKKAILKAFPSIPDESMSNILNQALKKRSGRVGRTGTLPLKDKARLAVWAHIRHCHTNYDDLIRNEGVERDKAREDVRDEVIGVSHKWQVGEMQQSKEHFRERPKGIHQVSKNHRPKRRASLTAQLPLRSSKAPKHIGMNSESRKPEQQAFNTAHVVSLSAPEAAGISRGQRKFASLKEGQQHAHGKLRKQLHKEKEEPPETSGNVPRGPLPGVRRSLRLRHSNAAETMAFTDTFFDDEDEPALISSDSSHSSTAQSGGPKAHLNSQEDLIIISSDGSDAEGQDMTDFDEAFQQELNNYSDDFIVDDNQEDSDYE